MTSAEEALKSFMDSRDLGVLHDKPIIFPKSREFIRSENSFALRWFMWCGCVPCLAPVSTFQLDKLYDHFSLELYSDSVRVFVPVNVLCSVQVEKTRLILESIVDITLEEDKFSKPFGLKQMSIWTYGDTEKSGPTVSVTWVADAEQARDAILLASSLRKIAIGQVPLTVPVTRGELKAGGGSGGGGIDSVGIDGSGRSSGRVLGHIQPLYGSSDSEIDGDGDGDGDHDGDLTMAVAFNGRA